METDIIPPIRLSQPIIIFGTGRSGTTIFHRMFSKHPHLFWMSNLCNKYPATPAVNRCLMSLIDVPITSALLKQRYPPSEAHNFWGHHVKGFRRPFRDLKTSDLTPRSRQRILKAFSGMATKNRHRLLLKITGWPRIGLLSALFPDAKFIHVIRDGRAVANSILNTDFWRGWEGPEKWRWGALSEQHQAEWEKQDKSFVALAAIQWKILMAAAEEAQTKNSAAAVLNITYESLCRDPVSLFSQVAEFCGLDWLPQFEKTINATPLKNSNQKYKKHLNADQQAILEAVLCNDLKKYGYK